MQQLDASVFCVSLKILIPKSNLKTDIHHANLIKNVFGNVVLETYSNMTDV